MPRGNPQTAVARRGFRAAKRDVSGYEKPAFQEADQSDCAANTSGLECPAGVNRHDPKLVFPITHDIVYDEFQKILKAAGIEDYTFHDLRHEATSTFAERGLTLVELQKLTGHRVLTQLLRYTHLADEHMRQRIDETEDKSYGRVAKFLTTNVPNKGGAAAPSLPKVAAPSGANIVIFRPKPRGG